MMTYDAAGRRTQLTWGDGRYVSYQYNGASALSAILENGTTQLVTYAYDAVGRRTSLTRGNGVVTSYSGYTPLGATAMAITLPATANNLTLAFAYNAAGQIKSRASTSSNQAWTYQGYFNVNRPYTVNALNQYTVSGSVTPTYDAKGNLASAGGSAVYGYSTKNELITRSDTGSTFYHDPRGRLDTIATPSATTRLQYNGADIATEVDGGSGTVLRRYVHGAGVDEALVWYEGADFSNRRYTIADERGSVIAVTDASGNPLAINTYDEYGIPGTENVGRFQYTGQAWVEELGMYSYKARLYSPTLGRFMQTDPAGYPNGPNWYAYAGNDPINVIDTSGMGSVPLCDTCSGPVDPDQNSTPVGSDPYPNTTGSVYATLSLPNGTSTSSQVFSSYSNYFPSQTPTLFATASFPQTLASAASQSNPHQYDLDVPLGFCASRADAFEALRSFSAPLAPYAQAGGPHEVELAGNNWIDQTVDTSAMTIKNVAIPGRHVFGGYVMISMFERNGLEMAHVHGGGSGPNPGWNQFLGPKIFRALGIAAFSSIPCNGVGNAP